MENEASEKPFKILSIDGGGIKGLYSATILNHFEEKFNCLISNYFDLLCGTSTGGLIALAASLKIPMSKIVTFYESEGSKIFPQSKTNWLFSKLLSRKITNGDFKQILGGGKFSDAPLKEALKKVFGDHKIGESNNYLCIPTYTITEARPWVFKKDHHDLTRDDKALYVDVALATSAAPTFFPLAEISYYDNKQFIDGGVWANNPTLVGLLEWLKYFKPDYETLNILSISSLSVTSGKPTNMKRQRSFIDWKEDLFETSLTGQSFFTNFFMEEINKLSFLPINYFRIPSTTIDRDQLDHIKLDVATKTALELIKGKGNDVGLLYEKRPEIAQFFKNIKLSKLK